MNKSPIILILMVSLVLSVGCAKPDWIQNTLVTVDVTGKWRNTDGTFFEFTLDQQGQQVTGSVTLFAGQYGMGNLTSGGIEGTVAGDVFRFNQTSGTMRITGEMTVSGDEMSGRVKGIITGSGLRTLQRVGSPQ